MTAQGTFLLYVKSHPGLLGLEPAKVIQVDKLTPRFKAITRTEPLGEPVGGMQLTQRIDTGKVDKSVVEVHAKNHGLYVELSADGVKRKLRRLRPQESERLTEIDAGIQRMETMLRELRQQRKDLLREAFTKGHRVTVEELRAAAEAESAMEETVIE